MPAAVVFTTHLVSTHYNNCKLFSLHFFVEMHYFCTLLLILLFTGLKGLTHTYASTPF